MAGEKALLEQILRCVHDQSVLGERRHEAQVSQQLRYIREQAEAASAREAAESMLAKVALECGGDISACQEEILANASFLGGDDAYSDEEEEQGEDVLATTPPPDARQQQGQGYPRPRLAPQHYLFK